MSGAGVGIEGPQPSTPLSHNGTSAALRRAKAGWDGPFLAGGPLGRSLPPVPDAVGETSTGSVRWPFNNRSRLCQ